MKLPAFTQVIPLKDVIELSHFCGIIKVYYTGHWTVEFDSLQEINTLIGPLGKLVLFRF